eukprot:TRINITY_DN103234_c0_g1_i1.p1 TRINITY_DN103234_c0_g1~~TRINITY_DN103234_c0_g1_i1.p1  ORF type:complete len:675 (-),score=99.49 TRINITY_DN103234_c0_g1_i1:510-2336(-)
MAPDLRNLDARVGRKGGARMRIIAVNDVYKLDNFPRLKTLVRTESQELPSGNCITTMAGDFLGPSLLSSLDGGGGMICCMNEIPIDCVCFGNHETDVPYSKLVQRIEEFNGRWVNGNMPDFEPPLPPYFRLALTGEDGRQAARTVAITGFCIGGGHFSNTYREGAFGGAAATMAPVIEAARDLHNAAMLEDPKLDAVIPLTHQDLKEDIELAETNLFPVIVAGHDHDAYQKTHGDDTLVVKAGMDASHAAIIDLEWPADPDVSSPKVTVVMKDVKDYEPDADLTERIKLIERPVRELEQAVIYEMESQQKLTSVGCKFGESSMARFLATAIRDCLRCDAAVINSGAVRGNNSYTDTLSYGDLQKECPYPSVMLAVKMPWEVLRDAIRWSRKPWWDIQPGEEAKEATSSLQIDHAMEVDKEHLLVKIKDESPLPGQEFVIACDSRVLKKNEVFKEYCSKNPDRIPPDDTGRPVLPILVEYFCGEMWKRLLQNTLRYVEEQQPTSSGAGGKGMANCKLQAIFNLFDSDRNGTVDAKELTDAIRIRLGPKLSSSVLVQQMISTVDDNGDGRLSFDEIKLGVMHVLGEHVSRDEFKTARATCVLQRARTLHQ